MLGEPRLNTLAPPSSGAPPAAVGARRGGELLHEARERERAGCIPEAIECYESAIAVAEQGEEQTVLAEALRRLAVLRHHGNESARARELCRRSLTVARSIGNDVLAAEALNTVGGLDLTTGSLDDARKSFLEALDVGGRSRELRARVEQNLGILANIQGDLDEALTRYERSLEAYREAGDEHGCAIAYHNLGMASADLGLYPEADKYFLESRALAERSRDVYLQGLCLVNQAEVDVARQRFENARNNAEAALALFDQLGARRPKADAYRVLGMVYRESGRPSLAESRLRSAIELSVANGSVLGEAEASHELALLYQAMGRNQKARVARNAVAMARALGLDDEQETTLLIGAYLHDLGKMRVPHEILTKPGPLTHDELEVVQMHPLWGIEMLASVEFPWDIKPIIRWHHERYDGSGYPDRLKGDEIPLSAQIVGILDVYDALTTNRAHQPGLSHALALESLTRCRSWWSDRVFEAFLGAIAPRST
ncbi:MAG: hypothetical protein DMD74_11100 [Gemmatimonadetes bacterium]|nr:MAG: hypothetical protein DMD74_11100 [Gemmatimonadota bacterium]